MLLASPYATTNFPLRQGHKTLKVVAGNKVKVVQKLASSCNLLHAVGGAYWTERRTFTLAFHFAA